MLIEIPIEVERETYRREERCCLSQAEKARARAVRWSTHPHPSHTPTPTPPAQEKDKPAAKRRKKTKKELEKEEVREQAEECLCCCARAQLTHALPVPVFLQPAALRGVPPLAGGARSRLAAVHGGGAQVQGADVQGVPRRAHCQVITTVRGSAARGVSWCPPCRCRSHVGCGWRPLARTAVAALAKARPCRGHAAAAG